MLKMIKFKKNWIIDFARYEQIWKYKILSELFIWIVLKRI